MVLAENQKGLVRADQLTDLGLNRQAVARRRESGLLIPVLPSIYRLAGTPSTWLLFARATYMWLAIAGSCPIERRQRCSPWWKVFPGQ